MSLLGNFVRFGFIEMDPPASLQFRRAINPLFSQQAAAREAAFVERVASDALDEVVESGHFDIVREYTDRIPAMTTLHVMGLGAERWREYVEFFHNKVGGDRHDAQYESRHGAGNWVQRSMAEAVAERRAHPGDDGLSWLLQREIGDHPITDEEAVESMLLIMIGGLDTTSALLANTFFHLGENPSDRRLLIERPALMDSACEEFLRYFSPVQNLARTVRQQCELAGRSLEPGARVWLSWAAANLDDREFDDPETVRLDRFPNRHQAFGLGTHRCAGSHFARMEFACAVSQVLRRIPDYRVLTDRAVRYEVTGVNNGWQSMPVEFTPSRRASEGRS